MTPARYRAILVALLVTFAVASGATGVWLLAADPEAASADVGQVPTAAVAGSPAGVAAPGLPARSLARTRATVAAARAAQARRAVKAATRPLPAAPSRLLIGAVRLRAPVVPIGAGPDGELAIPDEPRTVGWWVGSAPAGDPRGSTVLAGHIDSAGGGLGALSVLGNLPPGTRIVLTDVFGAHHPYRLAARRTYPKHTLPPEVLQRRAGPRLVLVTCGGPFDQARRTYRDNLVVYAVPT